MRRETSSRPLAKMTRKQELREMSTKELLQFMATLSTRNWQHFTEEDICDIGIFIASDGCTGVPDFFPDCCIIHDWIYATHRDFYGIPRTQKFADNVLKLCIQKRSWFGKWSPMAAWRYKFLRTFGGKNWESTD